MRFSTIVAVLGAAASASASVLVARQFPSCAVTCLSEGDVGDCVSTDNACLCRNQPFIAGVTQCITSTCEGADLEAALTGAQGLCEVVGVTLTAPTADPTGSGSSSAPASTGSSTGSRTSTATTPASTSPSATAPAASQTTTSGAKPAHGLSAVAGIAAFALAAVAL